MSLHCPPVAHRIDFKILLRFLNKAFNGLSPSYLPEPFLLYEPSTTLRSSGTRLLIIPEEQSKTCVEVSIHHYDPRLWDELLEDLKK